MPWINKINKTHTDMHKKHLEKDNIEKGYLVWKKVIPPFVKQPSILPIPPFFMGKISKNQAPFLCEGGVPAMNLIFLTILLS